MINHKIAKVAGATVAVAAVVALSAGSASAAVPPPHKIVAGTTQKGTAAFTGTINPPGVVFTVGTIKMTCKKSVASGTVKLGPKVSATRPATIGKSTWSGCVGPAGIALFVVQRTPWYLNTTSKTVNGVTQGFIGNVHAYVHAANPSICNFVVTGTVGGNYANPTHLLNVNGGATGAHKLLIGQLHGCFGLIHNGQHPHFLGHYKVTTPKGFLKVT